MAHVDASPAVNVTGRPWSAAEPVRRLLRTPQDWTPTLIRVALGAVIFPHGAQKALGWFGGPSLSGTLGFFRDALSVPPALTLLVVAAEFLGAIGLVLGLLTRVAAAGIAAVMIGAVALVHWQHGLFMNWFGTQAGEGFEFHVLAIALAVALLVQGGGRCSLDGILLGHLERR